MENNFKNENTKYQIDNENAYETKKEIILNVIKQELKMQKSKFFGRNNHAGGYLIILYVLLMFVGEGINTINYMELGAGFGRQFAGKIALTVFGIYAIIFWAHALIMAFIKGMMETMSNGSNHMKENKDGEHRRKY